MRRHPSLARLLSVAPALFASVALAQDPGAPSAGSGAAAPSPEPAPPLAPAPSELAPAAEVAAPAAADARADEPAAPPKAVAAPAPAAPRPRVSSAPAPRAELAPLPPRRVEAVPDAAVPGPEAAPIPRVAAWLGLNTLWIPSGGFDVFSEDDALTLFDVGAALSLTGGDVVDLAAVVTWGAASSDAAYRTQPAALDVMRVSAGPELRGSIIDRLYWHGRLSPTATRLAASVDESSSRASLSDSRWAFGVDAAVGLDLRFVEATTPLPAALGFFARLEAGYAWSQRVDLELEARDGGAPVRSEALALPELALGGPALRASVGAGF